MFECHTNQIGAIINNQSIVNQVRKDFTSILEGPSLFFYQKERAFLYWPCITVIFSHRLKMYLRIYGKTSLSCSFFLINATLK